MSQIYYHYCSLETFYNIVQSKNIRLCNIYKMNDYKEYIYIDEIIEEQIGKYTKKNSNKHEIYIKNFKRQYYEFKKQYIPHIACFSKNDDMLSQWRGYADDGRGVAIGFNFSALNLVKISPNYYGQRGYSDIIYNRSEHEKFIRDKISEYMRICIECSQGNDIYPLVGLINTLLSKSTIFKNEGFSEEEVRIIYLPRKEENISNKKFYIKNNEIISFFELDFKCSDKLIPEIILGPKFKMEKDDADFKAYLEANNLKDTNVIYSKISYR